MLRKAANKLGAKHSESGVERRHSGMSELSALAGSEGYGACVDDAGAYRFRRGHGSGNSGRWRLATLKRALLYKLKNNENYAYAA